MESRSCFIASSSLSLPSCLSTCSFSSFMDYLIFIYIIKIFLSGKRKVRVGKKEMGNNRKKKSIENTTRDKVPWLSSAATVDVLVVVVTVCFSSICL